MANTTQPIYAAGPSLPAGTSLPMIGRADTSATPNYAVGIERWVMTAGNLFVPAPIDASNNPIASITRATTIVLNQASAAQTASGNSANLSVGNLSELAIGVNVTAVSGTSPTLNLYLDVIGADGVTYEGIWASAQVTAVGQVTASVGAGLATNQAFGSVVVFRWVVGGTTPSFTFSASILGK